MESVLARSKAFAQSLYYIRRMKYGTDTRIPSNRICIVDKNQACFIKTEDLKNYYLKTKNKGYDWDLQPSNPCNKLVTSLSKDSNIQNLHVYELSKKEDENNFITQIKDFKDEQLSFFGTKKEINDFNFYEIFRYWQSLFGSYAENGKKSSEYFITDIERGRVKELGETGEVLFMLNSGENIIKNLPLAIFPISVRKQ